jgi:hypothetical protein
MQENYIEVNIWATDMILNRDPGHVSLKIHSENGDSYFSYWPAERGGSQKAVPVRLGKTYASDCSAEGKEPDGVYRLPITRNQADEILSSIAQVEKNLLSLRYILLNQNNANEYNCSGMVEDIVSKNLGIDFSDKNSSLPNRTATVRHHRTSRWLDE